MRRTAVARLSVGNHPCRRVHRGVLDLVGQWGLRRNPGGGTRNPSFWQTQSIDKRHLEKMPTAQHLKLAVAAGGAAAIGKRC